MRRRSLFLLGRGSGRDPAGQQTLERLLQLRSGVHAELVSDDGTRLLISAERLGVPPSPVQGADEQQPQLFLEGLIGKQPAQIGDGEAAAMAADVRLDAQLQRGKRQLIQASGLGINVRRRRNIGQRPAAPQEERVRQQLGGLLRIVGRKRFPAPAHQGRE